MDANTYEVPRGNTYPGVNRAIIEYFLAHLPDIEGDVRSVASGGILPSHSRVIQFSDFIRLL